MASILKVDKLDPQSGTALEIGTSGDTITVPSGATLDISASTLTPPATMPASSGVNFTALNASNLGSGTVPAARLSGIGKVLQVVTGYLDGIVSTTSTTYADTGLDADITLASTSSKVLIQATLVSCYNNAINNQGMFRIMRDDTTNLTPYPDSGEQGHIGVTYCPGEKINSTINFMFEDSPASTSSLNYSIYMACQTSGDMRMNQNDQRSYIHLMEIGA